MCLGIDTQQYGGIASWETAIGAVDVLCHLADAINLRLCIGFDRRLDLAVMQERAACSAIIVAAGAKLALGQFASCFVHVRDIGWANRFVIAIQSNRIGECPVFTPDKTKA